MDFCGSDWRAFLDALNAFYSSPDGAGMTAPQIERMRDYLRQWIDSSVWARGGVAGEYLEVLRVAVRVIQSGPDIAEWLEAAEAAGFDPL